MMFNSYEFIVFFAVFFVGYFSLPQGWRNVFLILGSYFFYGFWSVPYLGLLLFTMTIDYLVALAIEKESRPNFKRMWLIGSLVVNLGILFTFKYFNLFSGLVASLSKTAPYQLDWILPFGISFYTFHAMSYVIDVHRGQIRAERSFIYYSGYVMFFPQLVAGPIARASHLLPQFLRPKTLKIENLIEGSYLVAKGYLFKTVLADKLGMVVDAQWGEAVTQTPFLIAQTPYFFAFQIYLDFFGYTLIARGIAKWLDFDLVENFNTPYFSTSITNFWKRWHMSLSTWLRDYLYIPLGGNRAGEWLTYRNLLITMLLGGLWHGANWTFLVWGGLHGSYLVMERALSATTFGSVWRQYTPRALRWLLTFHAVVFAWVFFRASTFYQASSVIEQWWRVASHPIQSFSTKHLLWSQWAIVGFVLVFEWWERRVELPALFARAPVALRYAALYATIVAALLFSVPNPKTFIYFQF